VKVTVLDVLFTPSSPRRKKLPSPFLVYYSSSKQQTHHTEET